MSTAIERSPAALSLELIGRDYLSYSAVTTFQACPLRYYFRYVRGLPEPVVSSSLVFGSGIHAALEAFYRERLAGFRDLSRDELLAVYRHTWHEFEGRAIQFGKGETQKSLELLATKLLQKFLTGDLVRIPGRILGIEEEFRETLIPGCPPILARLDLLIETDVAVKIIDFKTSRSRWSEDQLAASSLQLWLYHDLVAPIAEGRRIELEFAVFTKTKLPELYRLPVPVERSQVLRAQRIVGQVWEAIRSGIVYPHPGPMTCAGCPFREPCLAWDGRASRAPICGR